MSFRPYPSYSGFIFLGVAVIFGLVAFFFGNSLLAQSEPSKIFLYLVGLLLTVGLGGVALYGALVALKLTYHVSRNGLVIQWGLNRQRIPIHKIDQIILGVDVSAPLAFKGLKIDGLHLGSGNLAEFGRLIFRTTAPLYRSLLIVTPEQVYVISPHQIDAFVKAWQARRALGPTQHWTLSTRRQWPLSNPLVVDPLTWWLLGGAALLGIALLGYISLNYADLPPSLPIHFNSLGRADRIADKMTLFILPAAGATVWLVNALLGSIIYSKEKVGAYLLWGSSVAMQLCLWVAVFTITA